MLGQPLLKEIPHRESGTGHIPALLNESLRFERCLIVPLGNECTPFLFTGHHPG